MAEENSSPDRIEQLDKRLDYLESIARETIARLYAIENHLGIARRPAGLSAAREPELNRQPVEAKPSEPSILATQIPQPQTEVPSTPIHAAEPPAPETVSPPSTAPPQEDLPRPAAPDRHALGVPVPQGPPPARTPATTAAHAQPSQARARSRGDLEARIGGNWFNIIGIIAIAIGVAFFLKYAFDNQWIGPWGRVLIGVGTGLAFLVGGERLRQRYQNYAYGLTGGGVLILYLSIYAAYAFFREPLIGQMPAFVCMAVVTAVASLLAARYAALPIAFLGFIGGFLTPILLSTGVNNPVGLFGYIALLDVGVLALAYSKQWRSLNYSAFIATVLMFAGWIIKWDPQENLWTAIFFLTLFFVIFALLAVLYNVVNRRPTQWADLALVFMNGLLYFGTSYQLLEEKYRGALGLFAVMVAAFYLALGFFAYNRDREDRFLVYTFLGLAFLFLVLAVPIQFNQHWVTMGWAIEGAVMTWIGLRVNDRTSRYAALVVFVIAVTHWALGDVQDFAYHASETFAPLLNRRAFSCAVLVAALSAAAVFYRRSTSEIDPEERSMFTGLYVLGANILAVTLLSLDANDYFKQLRAVAFERSGAQGNFGRWDGARQIESARQLTLSALWSIYGATALIVGVMRGIRPLRVAAAMLLAVTTFKVLVVDSAYYNAPWHTAIFNETFAAYALLILALSASAWFYAKAKGVDKEESRVALRVLIGGANILAVIAMSMEVLGHYARVEDSLRAGAQQATGLGSLENTKQLILSAVWILYGSAAFFVGIKRRLKPLRAGALMLVALATAKIMIEDLPYYDASYHTLVFNQTFAAFALLVCALAAIAWLYARGEGVEEGERRFVMPLIIVGANLLALIALSAEAAGYFDRAQAASPDLVNQLENSKQLALSALWTVYAAAALGLGVARRSKLLRWGALGLLTLTTLKVIALDLSYYDAQWHSLIFNQTFTTFALLILVMIAGIRLYSRAEGIDEQERASIIPVLVAAANLLALVAFSAEAYGFYAKRIAASGTSATDLRDLRLAQQLSLSVIWTVYGGAMLAAGIARRNRMLRMMALGLLGLTIIKVFLLDLSSLEKVYRIVSFIVLGAILLAVSFLYQRYRQRMADLIDDRDAEPPLNEAPVNLE